MRPPEVRCLRRKPGVLACLLLLGACAASPPPAPTGPVLPPGLDHGRIEQGVYYDKRDWYSVALPFHAGEDGYDSLSVAEFYPPGISYAAFVPGYTAGEYYRVYIEDFFANNRPVPDLPQVADMATTFFGKQLVAQRVEPLRLVEERPWNTAKTTGFLRLYTEKVPTTFVLQDLGMAEDYTAYILMYVTVDRGKVAVVWAEWPVGCAPCKPVLSGPPATADDPIDQALAADARAGAFIASFGYGIGAN